MGADVLATQGAKAPSTMRLTIMNGIDSVLVLYRLMCRSITTFESILYFNTI